MAPANEDEEKIPKFELTDSLKTTDGRTVNSPELWNNVRRPELLKLFEEEMYGKFPMPEEMVRRPSVMVGHYVSSFSSMVYNGKGNWVQLSLHFAKTGESPTSGAPTTNLGSSTPTIHVLAFRPSPIKFAEKVPLFLGLNFQGNHTVDAEPQIRFGTVWRNGQPVPAKAEDRGSQASRWPIEKILDRGYAVATAYYQDIEPDFDGGSEFGIRQLVDQKGELNEGNAIATWAWGLSLIRDSLERRLLASPLNIDPDKIIVIGHSRLGKAALWAAAQDEKFAMAISNNSGCGGAALTRREFGETVHQINTSFPHWFNGNFKKYNHDVGSLPFDQHELIALIAPRPVYIASAVEDRWADPKGEFLSGLYADPVYRLLGTDGFAGVTEIPELNKSVGGTIGYHIRSGEHDVTEYDWEQFLNFADKHFKK